MKNNKALIFLTLVASISCTSKKPEKKPIIYPNDSPEVSTTNPKATSIAAKQLATEQGTRFVTEIKFDKNQDIVSAKDQGRIKALYRKAHKQGKVEEVQLITWADKEFPSKDQKELNTTQQELVDERNKSLAQIIERLDKKLDIKKISMAERADALAQFTATDEAQIKDSLEIGDASGRSGEAMIIFILEKK